MDMLAEIFEIWRRFMRLPKTTYQVYCDILKEELRLAMGCTEPIAIAYASAVARGYMDTNPTEIMI